MNLKMGCGCNYGARYVTANIARVPLELASWHENLTVAELAGITPDMNGAYRQLCEFCGVPASKLRCEEIQWLTGCHGLWYACMVCLTKELRACDLDEEAVKVLLRRQMHAYVGVVGRHRSPALYARWLKNR